MATRSTRGLFSVVIDRIYSMVKVVIYDEAGNTAGVTAGGELKTTATITGTVITTPGLPPDAATETKQTAGNASLTSIDGHIHSIDGKMTACNTGAVVVSSSALPTGAATEATLNDVFTECQDVNTNTATIAGDTTSIDGKITACDTTALATEATLFSGVSYANTASSTLTAIKDTDGIKKITDPVTVQATHLDTRHLNVTDDAVTATVTGTVTANAGTNLNTSLLATEATLALIKAKTDNIPSDPSKESGKLASIDSALSTLSAKLDNLEPADTITEYSITCTNANTEYSQALPAGTKKIFYINTADYPWRASYVTGKVATPTHPYEPIGAGISGSDDGIFLTSKTLYVASTHAGDVIFVRCWT
jgi:outer membrane murein-binding lipoprotein Lpp